MPRLKIALRLARRPHERRDHVAMAIAEGDDPVPLHLLVPAKAEVVAALFRRRVNDCGVEKAVPMKP
jgi:hypothetical protein